jgi:hypothetical protein
MRYINVLLPKHTKKIYPRNIPNIFPNNSYENYLKNFLYYIDEKKDQLSDLWMIIGAENIDSDSVKDLTRFHTDYDIAIGEDNINFNEPKLLALKFINIYNTLNIYLPNKFSKIIYDWSTTKFVKDIFADLQVIKNLMSLYGVLYFDIVGGNGGTIDVFSFKKSADTYYLTKSDSEFYRPTNYNEFGKAYITLNDRKIYNSYKLFDKINFGKIQKNILEEHIRLNTTEESGFVDIDDIYINSVIQKLKKKIFPEDKFIVNHYKKGIYPNNPIGNHGLVKYYYEIIRIAL